MNEKLYSIQLEQSVLSTLMTLVGGADDQIGSLSPEHFYAGQHNVIFKHLKKLHSIGSGHDAVMVWDSIKLDANDCRIVSEKFLMHLMSESPASSLMLEQHTRRLIEHSSRRALFNAGEKIKTLAVDTTQFDLDGAISASEVALAGIECKEGESTLKNAFALSVDLYEKMAQAGEDRKNGVEKIDGVSTGFRVLDEKIGTLKKGDLVYIGARPSMGKTAFCQDIILSAGFYQQLPVIFHSIEMPAEKIMKRMVSSMADINLNNMNKNHIPDDAWSDFNEASQKLHKSKIFIDESSSVTLSDIRRNCRKIKADYGFVGLIVIDYLTLITSPIKSDMMHLSIGAISKGLKKIAKEFDCPVICLSQLNRSVEKRPDKRPMLSDLRESGSVEEDADVVLFIYRDEYYNKKSQEAGTAEIIAAKVRDGEVGTVRLGTELQYSRFSELDASYYESLEN